MLLHRLEPARVGLERAIERASIPRPQRSAVELGGHVVLPAAARPIGVRHVARRLLEVGHQAAPLEHLRQDVRHAFAGEVHAAELRDRVVAVFGRTRARTAFRRARRRRWSLSADRARRATIAEKLVEEQTPQRLGGARIAREQRALDGFRQVGQREDRPSRLVKYGASARCSSGVNSDTASDYTRRSG